MGDKAAKPPAAEAVCQLARTSAHHLHLAFSKPQNFFRTSYRTFDIQRPFRYPRPRIQRRNPPQRIRNGSLQDRFDTLRPIFFARSR